MTNEKELEIIHKWIDFAKNLKTESEPYKSGAGYGYSCGYAAAQEGGTGEANPKKFIMQRFGLSKTLFLYNQIEGLTYFNLIEMLTEYASQVSATDKKRIEELEKEVERVGIMLVKAMGEVNDRDLEVERLEYNLKILKEHRGIA